MRINNIRNFYTLRITLYYIGKEYGRWLSRKQFSRSSIFWPETARENEKEKTTYRATGLHAISYE